MSRGESSGGCRGGEDDPGLVHHRESLAFILSETRNPWRVSSKEVP